MPTASTCCTGCERGFRDGRSACARGSRHWGGNASGLNVANIDNLGHVHPDTMWWHHDLGSVRERPFSAIWSDTSDPLMAGLKRQPRPVDGRCGACAHLAICGGNTRVRAEQVTGDPWAEDPGLLSRRRRDRPRGGRRARAC